MIFLCRKTCRPYTRAYARSTVDIRTKCYTLLRTVPEAEPIIHVAASPASLTYPRSLYYTQGRRIPSRHAMPHSTHSCQCHKHSALTRAGNTTAVWLPPTKTKPLV